MKQILNFLRLVLFLGLLAIGSAYLADYSSEEIIGFAHVIDGDSISVDGREIRLEGIDAPEYRQTCQSSEAGTDLYPCGQTAANFLKQLISEVEIRCVGNEYDKYKRFLAKCNLGEMQLNQMMVAEGWAVAFGNYERAEARAKSERKGLWQGDFSLPSEWRRSQLEKRDSNWLSNLLDW
jgi:endonuclease YncB( thermonuclease family)